MATAQVGWRQVDGHQPDAGAPRARLFGLALLAAFPLLSGCASVVPDTAGTTRPSLSKPAPSQPLGQPRPYIPRPSERAGVTVQRAPTAVRNHSSF